MNSISKSAMANAEVERIIKELKSGELEMRNVPEEFALNSDVVKAERKLGLRKSGRRGFDVISQLFFVEEEWFSKNLVGALIPIQYKKTFASFAQYYEFLDGDIYENACYYQYAFEDEFSKNLDLDINRLTKASSFITDTIDNHLCALSQDEIAEFKHCENTNKKLIKYWLDKFNACDTYEQFKKVCDNYKKSTSPLCTEYRSIEFFFFQYAFDALYHKNHLDVIMKYLSDDYSLSDDVVFGLCLIHAPEAINDKYDFSQASAATNKKRKKEVKDFVEVLRNQDVEIKVIGYFDKAKHFYCEKTKVFRYENRQGIKVLNQHHSIDVCRAFETFDEFIKYRNGNLKNCDLSGAIDLNVDFSKYMIDDTTILPISKNTNMSRNVLKAYTDGKFVVSQFWSNENGKVVKKQIYTFSYFFDFTAFLRGDLSGANLLFCTGMKNLSNIDGINLSNAKISSDLCKQFNLPYKSYSYDKNLIYEFPKIEKNEEETALALHTSREIISSSNSMHLWDINRIGYISDLHLMHRIKNAECKSEEDVIYTMQKIIDGILAEGTRLTLVGGDVSSEFSVFELFVKMLRKSSDSFGKRDFVFVLGNHELWGFPRLSIEEIVEKYRTVLNENGMYLLHNDLLYRNESDDIGIVPYNELIQSSNSVIQKKLKCARLVILGGLGFSGYNEKFNAKDGVYRETVDRNTEIQESKKFEQLYNKMTDILAKKNTVIFTHTPKEDWCINSNCRENFVYVNGHTHRNMFFDDGAKRIYADNQIGYRNESPHLKNFLMDGEYDYFVDYEDGIYEITAQEYQDFSRGKNIKMAFDRQVNVLYMLKKNGYYCFIHKSKTGSLSMLNGGALKALDVKDIKYYYNNMDTTIAYFEAPLKKYTAYQESIANEIKKIGGSGQIHGCIIDIDYYNHVYVNPIDMTVRSYWAFDTINKLIFPNVPALLKAECPTLYDNYLKLTEGKEYNPLLARQTNDKIALLPQEYLETDIYKVSREIKKMQKLNSNVLTTWYDVIPERNVLPYRK